MQEIRDFNEVAGAILPGEDEGLRKLVLTQLLSSAQAAAAIAPDAWAATLFSDGFRLNVGPVEVFVLAREQVRLNLLARADDPLLQGLSVQLAAYKSMPQPQAAFLGSLSDFKIAIDRIRHVHEAFVCRAAVTSAGEPVKGTRFARSHSPRLMAYAALVADSEGQERDPGNVETSQELVDDELTMVLEGARSTVLVNVYERDPNARTACIAKWGANCSICSFNFGERYGDLGEGFIHVHHLKSLSEIGAQYELNPVTDLRPVCPNCHAMLHRRRPALSIDELAAIVRTRHG